MNFSFNPDTLTQTLMIMLKGLVGIFIVTGVTMLAIWVLNFISRGSKKEQQN